MLRVALILSPIVCNGCAVPLSLSLSLLSGLLDALILLINCYDLIGSAKYLLLLSWNEFVPRLSSTRSLCRFVLKKSAGKCLLRVNWGDFRVPCKIVESNDYL